MTANQLADASLRLDRQICFPFYAASHLINRLYGPVLSNFGLTYPQYLVMLVLWEGEPQSVGFLGKRLHLDSGTLTPLLKRLGKAGFIERERDPADERRVLVILTETGRALRAQAETVPDVMARSYPAENIEDMQQTICHFVSLLSEYTEAKMLAG